MEFFDTIKKRRSIRRFKAEPVADEVVKKALEAAILAPNSSNTQTWDFYWVKSAEKKDLLVKACLSQSAARTANQLIVAVADPKLWRRSQGSLIQWAIDAKAPAQVRMYYEKLIPLTYTWGFLNLTVPFKSVLSFFVGLARPFLRGPFSRRDLQEVAIKSCALACENFVLALADQGVASCMMEGFDEVRVRKLLKLSCSARVVMVIGLGYEAENGTWGPRSRLPLESVVHEV